MTESPGWINSTPLIEECAEALCYANDWDEYLHYYPKDQPEAYAKAVNSILSVLRRRGLVNQQGLELIQREMGE